MTENELQQYLKLHYPKENEGCEWKEFKNLKNDFNGKEKDDVISYVSALANMEGGHLVIGVVDKTLEIVGTDTYNYDLEKARLRLTSQCTNLPSEGLLVEEFITDDTQKTVWVIHVPRHLMRRPVYAHNKAWQRMDDSLVEMDDSRLNTILNEQQTAYDWSAEAVEGATLDWLDPDAIHTAREGYKQRHSDQDGDMIDSWSDAVFLDRAKITINQQITRTALLLLGKEEYQPYLGHIAQIVWKLNTGDELAGEIYTIPFLTATQKVLDKIRNYRFKIYPRNSMIPMEVWKYDTKSILEGLHNCIAHQRYDENARIVVTERKDELVFSNAGDFFAGKYEDYIEGEKTPDKYRNPFLAAAMVNVKMIDTQGFGIHNMFLSQKGRFLPMPDYDFSDPNKVELHMPGTVIDENYSLILIERSSSINLTETYLLDKVQKRHEISSEAIDLLRSKQLVEGRKPNVYVSKGVAKITGQQVEYSLNKGFDDQYYKDLLIKALKEHGKLKRVQIEQLLVGKLPNVLSDQQKKTKVSTILEALKRNDVIEVAEGRLWKLKDLR